MIIEVKNLNDTKHKVFHIYRLIRQHRGWGSATYKGKRYQVFGGIRGPLFIDLANPIRGRKRD